MDRFDDQIDQDNEEWLQKSRADWNDRFDDQIDQDNEERLQETCAD